MNKHVNKVRKATGRAEAITADRQQNKKQYLIIQLMKKKESIKQYLHYFLPNIFLKQESSAYTSSPTARLN